MTKTTNSPTQKGGTECRHYGAGADISGSAHSPLPWRQPTRYAPETGAQAPCGSIETQDGEPIVAVCWPGHDPARVVANAALIVAAVNSHSTLTARVQELEATLALLLASAEQLPLYAYAEAAANAGQDGDDAKREAAAAMDDARALLAVKG